MNLLPTCPKCNSSYAYQDGLVIVCPECSHEWTSTEKVENIVDNNLIVKDVHGNLLHDGDTVIVIKESDRPRKAGGLTVVSSPKGCQC